MLSVSWDHSFITAGQQELLASGAHSRSPPCARAQRVERLPLLVLSSVTMLPPQLYWLPLLAALLPPVPAQKFSALTAFPSVHTLSPVLPHPHPGTRSTAGLCLAPGADESKSLAMTRYSLEDTSIRFLFLRVDQDKDRDCSLDCPSSSQKPLCASDGRTFLSRCEFQRAKCKDPQLEIAHRGNCKARKSHIGYYFSEHVKSNFYEFQDVSRCVAERKYTQEQARKEFQQVFIPECNDDGTYSQVQCHSYTGYCWCVTPNGRPISGTAVAHKTPRCPGSINEKLPQREGAGKADDAAAPALETQPQGDEEDIASRYPTLWTEQVKSRQNKTNKNSASSCDQEHQSALEEAKQPKNDNVVIPECAHGGLYKPVQCHPSTGYCWCVLVDTGRPIPGTSTRYEQPKCDNTARAHPAKARDLYKNRPLQGEYSVHGVKGVLSPLRTACNVA
ncbi:SPARC-related modular calcium-binding protein 2 [Microtus ochrogaster]|uniref:SPARC-related modular calcium-binding protein 2 n=1 Tax=Microtus ochrogaster TaxID=79684 RepID=A0A8J6KJU6_MICOH|nr:SPARC-related modular calcium-binding protein 2 [Microtus ochrogaster]